MAAKVSSSSHEEQITSLNPEDVVSGRGSGANEWIGNRTFRLVVDSRRNDYLTAESQAEKTQVAQEVYDTIKLRKGRFLVRVDHAKSFVLEDGIWKELTEAAAIEKCKQALREKPRKSRKKRSNEARNDGSEGFLMQTSPLNISPQRNYPQAAHYHYYRFASGPSSSMEILPQSTVVPDGGLSESRLRLLDGSTSFPFQQQQQQQLPMCMVPVSPSAVAAGGGFHQASPSRETFSAAGFQQTNTPPHGLHSSYSCDTMPSRSRRQPFDVPMRPQLDSYPSYNDMMLMHSPQQPYDTSMPLRATNVPDQSMVHVSNLPLNHETVMPSEAPNDQTAVHVATDPYPRKGMVPAADKVRSEAKVPIKEEEKTTNGSCEGTAKALIAFDDRNSKSNGQPSEWASSDEVSDFLLASLGWDSNHPKFTEEQFARERKSLSEEEQIEAVIDLFGKCCSVQNLQKKRARKDLDESTVKFLVSQMREEIIKVPEIQRRALVEAQKKARAEEFNDERLQQFLRVEGMNPKLAAMRFINYWESRQDVFEERYTMKMSLSEALSEDLAALESGVYYLLPLKDSSGRPLVFLDITRNNDVGYTHDSLLRAIWYVIEVAASESFGDFVVIAWLHSVTLFDFPRRVFGRLVTHEKSALPIKFAAAHCFVKATNAAVRTMMPLIGSLMDRRGRSRFIIHDVPANETSEAVAEYGITREMLPELLGGKIEINPREWIANRRAIELEQEAIG